jgi:hypothetical protein
VRADALIGYARVSTAGRGAPCGPAAMSRLLVEVVVQVLAIIQH